MKKISAEQPVTGQITNVSLRELRRMRGIIRLIRELQEGNPRAVAVLIFAVAGTAVILLVVGIVRARRRRR